MNLYLYSRTSLIKNQQIFKIALFKTKIKIKKGNRIMRKTNQNKKSNLSNNTTPNIKNNFTKIPNEIITINKNVLNDFAKLVYFYLLSLDAKNTYLTYGLLEKALGRSSDRVRIAISDLKENNLLKIEKVGINKYKYELINFREKEADKEEDKPKEADKTKNNVIFKGLIDTRELDNLEDKTEEDKKIIRFIELYNDICKNLTKAPKKINEDMKNNILVIMNDNEKNVVNTLKHFNNNANKMKNNFTYLLYNYSDWYRKGKKNSISNFQQRTYTKKEIKEIEDDFFNQEREVLTEVEPTEAEIQKSVGRYITLYNKSCTHCESIEKGIMIDVNLRKKAHKIIQKYTEKDVIKSLIRFDVSMSCKEDKAIENFNKSLTFFEINLSKELAKNN